MHRLLELSVRDLLDETATAEPTPGGGALAALTGAAAAAVVAMAARRSSDWDEAGAVVAQAELLRKRLSELAPANVEVYERALAALADAGRTGQGARDELLGQSLERAAAFPLQIADAASNVAELAALVAEKGAADARGDAAAAAMLALGATRAAAHLVEINLGVLDRDERLLRASRLAADAAAAAARTLASA